MQGLLRSDSEPSAMGHSSWIAARNDRRTCSGVSCFRFMYRCQLAHILLQRALVVKRFLGERFLGRDGALVSSTLSPYSRPTHASCLHFRPTHASDSLLRGVQEGRFWPTHGLKRGQLMVQVTRGEPGKQK